MTYKDIYDKFLIEYDKAGVSSSYPSLTEKEITALLDKAMLALIAQKVTGNNPRKAQLDVDTKGMADIQPLINVVKATQDTTTNNGHVSKNELVYKLIKQKTNKDTTTDKDTTTSEETTTSAEIPVLYILGGVLVYKTGNNIDREDTITIIPSVISDKYRETSHNKPWIKSPVAFMHDNKVHVLIDSDKVQDDQSTKTIDCYMNIIKCPVLFRDLDIGETPFVLSDTMCEELISLAVIFACKTVENPRLTTEIQTKSLEA